MVEATVYLLPSQASELAQVYAEHFGQSMLAYIMERFLQKVTVIKGVVGMTIQIYDEPPSLPVLFIHGLAERLVQGTYDPSLHAFWDVATALEADMRIQFQSSPLWEYNLHSGVAVNGRSRDPLISDLQHMLAHDPFPKLGCEPEFLHLPVIGLVEP